MSPEPTDRSLEPTPPSVTDSEALYGASVRSDCANATAIGVRGVGDRSPGKRHRDRKWVPGASSDRRQTHRLGPVEYGLLALIAVAVAITITMAALNPSA
jgi:hypothetical protein